VSDKEKDRKTDVIYILFSIIAKISPSKPTVVNIFPQKFAE